MELSERLRSFASGDLGVGVYGSAPGPRGQSSGSPSRSGTRRSFLFGRGLTESFGMGIQESKRNISITIALFGWCVECILMSFKVRNLVQIQTNVKL
jgi:hypothetical protein